MELGKILIVVGAAVMAFGLLLVLLPQGINPVAWFGKLPGDLSFSRNGTFIFVPITSMIVVSVVLSAALWLLRWLFPLS